MNVNEIGNQEDAVARVADILERNDGRSFDEKKVEAEMYLKEKEDKLAEYILSAAVSDERGRIIKEKFWSFGSCFEVGKQIILRQPEEADREMFIALQKECFLIKSMLTEEISCNMLWKEHTEPKALKCTIEVNGEYAGYCGINNVTRKKWEISIELLERWQHRGIGTAAIHALLDEIKCRMGIKEFIIRIDPTNRASQGLFEKMGAVPNGLATIFLHREEELLRCEEENLEQIDVDLCKVAEKFGVEPKKLLSHVLEYRLIWK